ncbi:MAG: hypothetical protein ACTSUE_11155 [Promethearchaeota archaeon]
MGGKHRKIGAMFQEGFDFDGVIVTEWREECGKPGQGGNFSPRMVGGERNGIRRDIHAMPQSTFFFKFKAHLFNKVATMNSIKLTGVGLYDTLLLYRGYSRSGNTYRFHVKVGSGDDSNIQVDPGKMTSKNVVKGFQETGVQLTLEFPTKEEAHNLAMIIKGLDYHLGLPLHLDPMKKVEAKEPPICPCGCKKTMNLDYGLDMFMRGVISPWKDPWQCPRCLVDYSAAFSEIEGVLSHLFLSSPMQRQCIKDMLDISTRLADPYGIAGAKVFAGKFHKNRNVGLILLFEAKSFFDDFKSYVSEKDTYNRMALLYKETLHSIAYFHMVAGRFDDAMLVAMDALKHDIFIKDTIMVNMPVASLIEVAKTHFLIARIYIEQRSRGMADAKEWIDKGISLLARSALEGELTGGGPGNIDLIVEIEENPTFLVIEYCMGTGDLQLLQETIESAQERWQKNPMFRDFVNHAIFKAALDALDAKIDLPLFFTKNRTVPV